MRLVPSATALQVAAASYDAKLAKARAQSPEWIVRAEQEPLTYGHGEGFLRHLAGKLITGTFHANTPAMIVFSDTVRNTGVHPKGRRWQSRTTEIMHCDKRLYQDVRLLVRMLVSVRI